MAFDPVMAQLPAIAFATLATTGATIAIVRGGSRYEHIETRYSADELNRQHGVTRAQARAMLAGALLGWRTRLADPNRYGDYGELLEDPALGI